MGPNFHSRGRCRATAGTRGSPSSLSTDARAKKGVGEGRKDMHGAQRIFTDPTERKLRPRVPQGRPQVRVEPASFSGGQGSQRSQGVSAPVTPVSSNTRRNLFHNTWHGKAESLNGNQLRGLYVERFSLPVTTCRRLRTSACGSAAVAHDAGVAELATVATRRHRGRVGARGAAARRMHVRTVRRVWRARGDGDALRGAGHGLWQSRAVLNAAHMPQKTADFGYDFLFYKESAPLRPIPRRGRREWTDRDARADAGLAQSKL